MLYHVIQTTDDVVVGQTREKVNEFVYDYSYWSLDSTDPRFASQEQVCTCVEYKPWVFTYRNCTAVVPHIIIVVEYSRV